MSVDDNEEVVLKISSSKDPGYAKKVAGAMSWRLREHGYCKARAIKADAVNTAVKAIAIVNQRVKPAGVTLGVDLLFAKAEQEATAIAMTIHEVTQPRPAEFLDYRVSGRMSDDEKAEKSIINKLAGAVASPVREQKGVRLRCIGPIAVYRAILACATAKGFICPNGLCSVVVPTWDTIDQPDSKVLSLIQVEFWGDPVTL
jgi:stage V sporulation protein SpoVS